MLDDDWIVADDMVARERGVGKNTSAGTIVHTKRFAEDVGRFLLWPCEAIVVTLFDPLVIAVDGFEGRKGCERQSRRTGANDIAVSLMKGLFNEVMFSPEKGK
jgi:hypothetical protein